MSNKHLINHLQEQCLRQGEAARLTFPLKRHPSNITGHSLLIFHSSPYPIAINRIYTRLSVFQGGHPSLYCISPALLALQCFQSCTSTWMRRTWKRTSSRTVMKAVEALKTQIKRNRGELQFYCLITDSKWSVTVTYTWFFKVETCLQLFTLTGIFVELNADKVSIWISLRKWVGFSGCFDFKYFH